MMTRSTTSASCTSWEKAPAPNVADGLLWLNRSADRGNASAMRLLADLYRHGYYGVPLYIAEADRWDETYARTEQPSRFYLHDLEGSR